MNPLWQVLGSFFAWGFGLALAGVLTVTLVVGVALVMAYPQLPDISDLADYRPKLSMRVFSVEGKVIGEFGEERRKLIPFKDIPNVVKQAVLSIEDARFYQHGGVDYIGLARASLANVGRAKSQGASTITMQVARNVYLSSEKTFTRKIYELLLTYKLEHLLSKDQIFEIYLNQIYLGHRAYGFAAAAETYFGKPIQSLSIAEAAMLAGLPKAPSAYNPINNPKRARSRQLYIIERMQDNGFITAAQATAAKAEELKIRTANSGSSRISHACQWWLCFGTTTISSNAIQIGRLGSRTALGMDVGLELHVDRPGSAASEIRVGVGRVEVPQEAFVAALATDADIEKVKAAREK